VFQAAAWLLSLFYDLVDSYAVAIGMIAVAVMILLTPLTLKSTKGMLEMQRLQPEMRRLQQEHRGDRQRLNEEMMKLYSEHKVNPLASCLPLLAQMPVFIIMFRVINKLTETGPDGTFTPSYLDESSNLYKDLSSSREMLSFGLDLAQRPAEALGDDFVRGLPYVGLVLLLGGLYFVQQRMVASRTTSPTMSPTQQKIMQYLPVAFAVFQLFFPTGLVVYYIVQALVRIGQQAYITRRFYGGEHSIGRQAQEASQRARDMAKSNQESGGQAPRAKKDTKPTPARRPNPKAAEGSRRTTPPKGRPTPPSKRQGSSAGRHPKPNRPKPPKS
jgi:YidC/Oxa1 family membrane protein insertase